MQNELGESLKETMKGIGNIRITLQPLDGVMRFWAECSFRHLSQTHDDYQFSVDAGRYVLRPARTPIDAKINLSSDSLPKLIGLIEAAAASFKATAETITCALFGGPTDGK